jgi:hypothetical protein
MVKKAKALIRGFESLGFIPKGTVTHESQPAPHTPYALPWDRCAVYVFSLSESYGQRCKAGPNLVLKVGKASHNARFQSHHYRLHRTASNLAGSLERHRSYWPFLGISQLGYTEGEGWICQNTDRDHFYLPYRYRHLLSRLERYLKDELRPIFEGRVYPITSG